MPEPNKSPECCELCRPNSLERERGLNTCRASICSCHFTHPIIKASDCSLDHTCIDPETGLSVPHVAEEWEKQIIKKFAITNMPKWIASNVPTTMLLDFVRQTREQARREGYERGHEIKCTRATTIGTVIRMIEDLRNEAFPQHEIKIGEGMVHPILNELVDRLVALAAKVNEPVAPKDTNNG